MSKTNTAGRIEGIKNFISDRKHHSYDQKIFLGTIAKEDRTVDMSNVMVDDNLIIKPKLKITVK